MVYLEVPASVPSMSLSLDGCHLGGTSRDPVPLSLSRTALVAEDIAGRQILLTSTSTPAGRYSFLHLGLEKISGKVGVAEVVPEPPPGGLSIPLDLELVPGSTTTVFLEWNPAAIDPEAPFHVPAIAIRTRVIPPLGSLAFATSAGSESVMVCDRQEGRVVSALQVDEDPRGLAYSRTGQKLFVALAGQDAIAVVDVLSLRVIKTVPLQFGADPSRLLLSRDEATLYVLCPGSRTLAALSVWSLQEQFRLAVGEGPRSLAQDPVSGLIFVACEDEGRIQVVDPGTGSVTRSLALLSAPAEMAIDDLSRLLFLGGSAQRLVRSFNLSTEVNVGDQNICGPVAGLAVNPRTRRVYASVPGCSHLAVVRPDLGIEYGSIPLDGSPGLMDFDQEYSQLWVVLPRQGAVAVCNVNSGVVVTQIEVDTHPFEVLVP
jgi:DNA-binding beta-propeller fold protein YncE